MPRGAVRTSLAERRNVMAAERTLMAWIRTSLAMISFGFTLGKLGNALSSTQFTLMFGRTTDIRGVAGYLVVIGTLALILAAIQYRADVAGMRSERPGHLPSGAFYMTSDGELFVPLDQPVAGGTISDVRLRAGLGYRESFGWRYEVLYMWTGERSAHSGAMAANSHAIDVRSNEHSEPR